MPKSTLYHNPRCTKSRQALAYLNEHSQDVTVVEYLKEPLSLDAVSAIYDALHISSAHKMIRPKEAEFKLAGLSKASSDQEVLQAIVEYPKLLERPILLIDDEKPRAAIGRPLDLIIDLLG